MTDNENHDDERRNRIKEFKQNQLFFLNEEKHFVSTYTKRKFCYGQIKPRPENAPYGGIIVTFQIIPCLEKGEDEVIIFSMVRSNRPGTIGFLR